MRALGALLLQLLLLAAPVAAAPPLAGGRAPDSVLTGRISRADHQSWLEAPFDFPAGADRLLVEVAHDGQEQRTVIDVGLADPNGFRGASGSNKRVILVAETEATPSYLPGHMPAGPWKLLLAVPNIRPGVSATWTAKLWFLKPGEPDTPPPTAGRGPGWYRGDLHLHSAHSDGACAPRGGGDRVPCPLFLTLETAAARGLDFVSVTEHNSVSHHSALREAQPYFPAMLLIPGREITTFFGHFNIHGVTRPLDFRIGPGGGGSFAGIAREVRRLGGLVVINHPALPSDERCMGCGWSMPGDDPALVDAIETVNGGALSAAGGRVTGPVDGTPFWLGRLARHGPVAALGASDNHDGTATADRLGTVGRPTTVVFADDLTQPALFAGIRAGRLFIDVAGVPGRHLDFALLAGGRRMPMGGSARIAPGAAQVEAEVEGPAGATLQLLDGTRLLAEQRLTGGRQQLALPLRLEAGLHLLRLQVVEEGQPILLSNAVRVEAGR